MKFNYKLKYYKDEENEFTESIPCDKSSIRYIISDNWSGDNSPNGLERVVISNETGQSLILEHFGKEVFEAYFLPLGESYHYHKMSRIELIYDALTAFMDNDTSWLEGNLNKTKKENHKTRKSIQTKSFKFEVTTKRLWSEVYQTVLLGIPLGLTFIISSIMILIKLPGALPYITSPFILFLGVFLWLPGLLLHKQYKEDNENLILNISKGNNAIHVELDGSKRTLQKEDITKITVFENPAYKMPWSTYEYAEIEFKSGEILNLTNLLIDQFVIYEKFHGNKIETKERRYPALKRKTTIDR